LALLEESREIQSKLEGVVDDYPLTEYHVRQARRAGTTLEERVAVIEKADEEELTAKQTRSIADSVAVAQSARRKQYLLDEPYSPHTHDPDDVRKREKRYSDHDPLLRDGPPDPPQDEAWRKLSSTVRQKLPISLRSKGIACNLRLPYPSEALFGDNFRRVELGSGDPWRA